MKISLALQHTYDGIEIGLLQNDSLVDFVKHNKQQASKTIVELIDKLLKKNKISLKKINFFICNQGPGPFTTLRVVIATLNGINFALKKPIIGVNSLTSILAEKNNFKEITIALLNAYSNDIYFEIQESQEKKEAKIGYSNITNFLNHLKKEYHNKKICFIGQGALLHQKLIEKSSQFFFINNYYKYCSIKTIGLLGYKAYKNKTVQPVTQLAPLYLKEWA